MKYIKTYKNFLKESLTILSDNLLDAIKAKEVNIKDILGISSQNDLDIFVKSENFIKALSKLGLKKSEIQNTADFETFIDPKNPIKFILIYDSNSSELENPLYILMESNGKIKLYEINDDFNNFYDKLSSKIIEIVDGKDKFIYETDNTNNWKLKSLKENEYFKRNMRKDELAEVIKSRNANVKII